MDSYAGGQDYDGLDEKIGEIQAVSDDHVVVRWENGTVSTIQVRGVDLLS
jgi:hypothetical protein